MSKNDKNSKSVSSSSINNIDQPDLEKANGDINRDIAADITSAEDAGDQANIVYQLRNRQILSGIHAAGIISYTDVSGKMTEVNENFINLSGYKREELIGQDHRVINSGLHPKSFFKEMWETISRGQVWHGEIINRAKSGELFYMQTLITPIKSIEGKITEYMALRIDIGQQKKMDSQLIELKNQAKVEAERNAKQTSDYLTLVLNYVPGPVYSKDLQGKYVFVNKKFFECIATPHRSAGTFSDFEIFPREIAEEMVKHDQEVINYAKERNYLEVVPHPDGSMHTYDTYKFPVFNSRGEVISVTGMSFDVTEKYKLQAAVETERAKALHSAKLASLGEMSAAIAHEINNPLTIIAGTLQLLPKSLSNPEKFNLNLDKLKKASGRIEKIVKGLRRFSRTNEGSVHKKEKVINVVNEVLILVEAYAKRHSVLIAIDVDPNLCINCDSIEMEQVLINLINNAVDAVKGLPNKWIKFLCFGENEDVVMQIIDSGEGISREIESKLFQPFFTTKPVGEGTGLGLSICKGILDQHKASITILHSMPNTCFEIRFKRTF